MAPIIPYRVSGHESFTCRYTWLPKIVQSLKRDNHLFNNEELAMVELGVGKNMVRSIRYWALCAGITTRNAGYSLTEFAKLLLDDERGLDPYLEDIRTLWIIHWKLATNTETPLLAWDFLINRLQEPEFTENTATEALRRETVRNGDNLSPATIGSHFQVFLHTYVPTRGRKGEIQEDNLDCPLVELEFIVRRGERESDQITNKREGVYSFNRDWKPEITSELFTYALNSFWNERHGTERELSLREVAHGLGSPGQIFKLPEDDVRLRLEGLNKDLRNPFNYAESINLQQVRKRNTLSDEELLKRIYE